MRVFKPRLINSSKSVILVSLDALFINKMSLAFKVIFMVEIIVKFEIYSSFQKSLPKTK